ncbi:MAG: hypothetical protein GY950_01230, partial [bacterium]|nr:hypothetical protein [bacterium]
DLKSISSRQFIRQFSGKDKLIKKFFDSWIFSRALPVVELSLVEGHKDMDTKDYKTVVIRCKQLNTDFVFPLKLRVMSRGKISIERVVMKAKEQDFVIGRDATIREVNVNESCYLVKEKKQPRHVARGPS